MVFVFKSAVSPYKDTLSQHQENRKLSTKTVLRSKERKQTNICFILLKIRFKDIYFSKEL